MIDSQAILQNAKRRSRYVSLQVW